MMLFLRLKAKKYNCGTFERKQLVGRNEEASGEVTIITGWG